MLPRAAENSAINCPFLVYNDIRSGYGVHCDTCCNIIKHKNSLGTIEDWVKFSKYKKDTGYFQMKIYCLQVDIPTEIN